MRRYLIISFFATFLLLACITHSYIDRLKINKLEDHFYGEIFRLHENNDFIHMKYNDFIFKKENNFLNVDNNVMYYLNDITKIFNRIYNLINEKIDDRIFFSQIKSKDLKRKVIVTLPTNHKIIASIDNNGNISILSFDEGLTIKDNLALPKEIDLRKVDEKLFDIEFLIKEGYIEKDKIPLILVINNNETSELEKISSFDTNARIFRIIPGVGIEIKKGEDFKRIVSSKSVSKVWLDYKARALLNETKDIIKAQEVWNLGYNGSGIKIAILDTGINSSHGDFFFGNGSSKIISSLDFTDENTTEDLNGHGTHVASIAAGSGLSTGLKGIAHEALLMNIKVLDRNGEGRLSDIIAGIEYATYGPDNISNTGDEADIISLSLGIPEISSEDPLSLACNNAVEKGIIVVAAVGNDGEYYSISSPASATKVIGVGATDKLDNIANFSSRGPTRDYRIKPDVVAPGEEIWAANYQGGSIMKSGTSMASPHLAGVAALIKQARNFDPETTKNVIASTAKFLENYDIFTQGAGRVNAMAAISTELIFEPAIVNLGIANNSNFSISLRNLNSSKDISVSLNITTNCNASLNVTEIVIPSNSTVDIGVVLSGDEQYCQGVLITNYTIYDSYVHAIFSMTVPLSEEIDRCIDITRPGNYSLISNISGLQEEKDYCIGIFVSNVFLDGKGNAILGNNENLSIYILNSSNVIVSNLKISNYSIGIGVVNSYNITITNTNLSSNNIAALFSIISHHMLIENNTIEYNDEVGVALFNSTNSKIRNNKIMNSSPLSLNVYLYNSHNNIIERNELTNAAIGIAVFDSSNNTIKNNIISKNTFGLYPVNFSQNKIYNNIFNNTYNILKWNSGIKVEKENYKVVYLAFGFEGINNNETRDTLMSRILNWLGYNNNSTVLLVDDDDCSTCNDYRNYYISSLTNLNVSYEIWDCEMGDPSYEQIKNYDIVIWFFGDDDEEVLSDNEIEAIKEYLENGGNLFITGQNLGWYLNIEEDTTDFYVRYFDAFYIYYDTQICEIKGIEGDPISNELNFSICGDGGANNQISKSGIAPISENASIIFIYSYLLPKNLWNTSFLEEKNIIGGNKIGGNVWLSPKGDGYSQKCDDTIEPYGICDQQYEIDENNIDYLPLKLLPDIFVDNLLVSPKEPKIEENVTIQANIINIGSEKANQFNVTFFINNEEIYKLSIPELDVWENKTLNVSWKPEAYGIYNIKVVADLENKIHEINESNNEKSINVSIQTTQTTTTITSGGSSGGGAAPRIRDKDNASFLEEKHLYKTQLIYLRQNEEKEIILPDFAFNKTNVFYLKIFSEKDTSIRFIIEKRNELPKEIPKPSNDIALILNIKPEMSKESVIRGRISFAIEIDKIKSKGFEIDNLKVLLLKWNKDRWIELPTTFLKMDENYIYYEAEVPNFSYFVAIIRKIKENLETHTSAQENQTTTTIINEKKEIEKINEIITTTIIPYKKPIKIEIETVLIIVGLIIFFSILAIYMKGKIK